MPPIPAPMAQPAQLDPGSDLSGRTVAGRYQLEEMLGKGGFGSVYSGRDSRGTGSVAVKVFRRSEGLAARAEREARTASKLTHPNIHTVVGVEADEDNAYLISELVVGERFDRTDLSDQQAVRAIAAVADALAHAHSRGVIHRDVKPANILVSTDGEVCLTDFGIARDEDALETTLEERLMGTLSYMAPEQAAGDRASGATDVWAAGLTLYSHLAGRNPFKARTLPDLLEKLREGARPLHETRPDIPRAVSDVLAQALDHEPRRRPDATELRDQLLACLAPKPDPAEELAAEPVPAPAPPPARALPRIHPLTARVGGSAIAAATTLFVLTAFPFYPTTWTLPLAAVLAVVAWFRPLTALTAGAVLCVPAFWNLAEAAGLLWIGMSATWIRMARGWGRNRVFAPLLAWPLALIGIGPAFVLVAATAPTQRRRIEEATLGSIIVLAVGGLVPAAASADVAGANNPLVFLQVLGRAPEAAAVALAMIVFATLLPRAWNEPHRRAAMVTLWAVGFGVSMITVPLLSGSAGLQWPRVALVAVVAAIIPAAWALVHPRVNLGR